MGVWQFTAERLSRPDAECGTFYFFEDVFSVREEFFAEFEDRKTKNFFWLDSLLLALIKKKTSNKKTKKYTFFL